MFIYGSTQPQRNFMTLLSGKKVHITATLTASLLLHLVAFGVIATMPPKVQPGVIKEYIPVELVQLSPTPREVMRAPAAVVPKPVKAQAPVAIRKNPAPSPPQVSQKIAALPQLPNDAPAAGQTLPIRTTTEPGSGTSGKVQPGTAVNSVPSARPGTGAGTPQPQKRDKGSYQAFYRLTRIPSFRSRAEPVYPNTERMTGSEARVLAEIYLDEHGTVDEVTIKKSGGRLFDKAVIDAVRQSSFHPGYMGEKAVPSVIQIPYVFKLK
jgi:TonB family protein